MGFFAKTSRFLNKTIVGKAISGAVGATALGRVALGAINEAGKDRSVLVSAVQPEVSSVAKSAQTRVNNSTNNNNNNSMDTNKIFEWVKANKILVAGITLAIGVAAYFLFVKKKVGRR